MLDNVVASSATPLQMWVVLALVAGSLVLYGWERISLEMTSMAIIAVLLLFFNIFPLNNADGDNILGPDTIMSGFANPALLTVLSLLVVGQALVLTGGVSYIAGLITEHGGKNASLAIFVGLFVVMLLSAFLNNTPVVVIFIPIIQALADRIQRSPSSLMIPLSFAAILGGMTTLIGSSTNLLVSSSLIELGMEPLEFFEFTVVGGVLALSGFVYVLLVAPRLLPALASMSSRLTKPDGSGKQFIAQITVGPASKMIGTKPVAGFFKNLPNVTIQMIVRREHADLPPFDEQMEIQPGDVLVVAATRKALTEALQKDPGLLHAEAAAVHEEPGNGNTETKSSQLLAEVMLPPGSRLIGFNLEQIGFRYQYKCLVLGIQRRSRMIRTQMTEIRLEAGDVLLVQGRSEDVEALRTIRDVVLLEWSTRALPRPFHARRAAFIFLGVIALAATGVVPIMISSFIGAGLMIASGALNMRQAARAIDRKIVLLVAAALALGTALQATGGASYVAEVLLSALHGAPAPVILSVFFLMVAGFTNVLSNNACAVLFTPIGIGMAQQLGVPPHVFAVAVVMAANCSFASPVGYQTNLLVMGPGHYRFVDFLKSGTPLILLLWIVFSLFAPWYYGLSF
ncbi:potassium transporter TrkA [Thalassospira profundimaris]|uniref:Potassium transporter TrkA n=1 Tax=Thalassospira profundimaris TaxID=502049 RepID=A0A367XC72_9PROT|nr:SLC13 family permease [Thalassospira profundimaris]RCK51276.1 potassium transporter TrkA [Thalassospira profundimaris]